MARRFTDDRMQQAYEGFLMTAPKVGPLGEAFRKGRAGYARRDSAENGSLCHAAWRAGRDSPNPSPQSPVEETR